MILPRHPPSSARRSKVGEVSNLAWQDGLRRWDGAIPAACRQFENPRFRLAMLALIEVENLASFGDPTSRYAARQRLHS